MCLLHFIWCLIHLCSPTNPIQTLDRCDKECNSVSDIKECLDTRLKFRFDWMFKIFSPYWKFNLISPYFRYTKVYHGQLIESIMPLGLILDITSQSTQRCVVSIGFRSVKHRNGEVFHICQTGTLSINSNPSVYLYFKNSVFLKVLWCFFSYTFKKILIWKLFSCFSKNKPEGYTTTYIWLLNLTLSFSRHLYMSSSVYKCWR